MRYGNGAVILASSLSYAIIAGALAALLLLTPAEVQEAPAVDIVAPGSLGGSLSDPALRKPDVAKGR